MLLLDMILRYYREYFMPLYMAFMDIAKAFDSVSHNIRDTLLVMGMPNPMIEYRSVMCTERASPVVHGSQMSCDRPVESNRRISFLLW